MMNRVVVDDKAAIAMLQEAVKQGRFAAAVALNRCAKLFQAKQIGHVKNTFTLRSEASSKFILAHAARVDRGGWATKQNQKVFISGANPKIDLLGKFEEGGMRTMRSRSKPFAIPSQDLRGSKATVIPRSIFPSALGLTPRRDPTGVSYYALGRKGLKKKKTPFSTTKRGATQIKGKRRTFVLDPEFHRGISDQEWGVYQRIGKGKGDIRVLWHYRSRIRVPKILRYHANAREVLKANWSPEFKNAFAEAMRTARPSRRRSA